MFVIVITVITPGVAHDADPIPVLADAERYEVRPAASDGYLVWSQRRSSYVMAEGGDRVRMDPPGTLSSSATIDGSTAVFVQLTDDADWDLFMYDVPTASITDPPEGVNTEHSETEPSISGDWLLFTRFGDPRSEIVLFNLEMLEQRVVFRLRNRGHYLISDQVNGDWATWEACDVVREFTNCQAYRYSISGETTETLPNPDRQQYAAGVTSDGTAYTIRTGKTDRWRCGFGARIVRIDVNGDAQVLATLPRGFDSFNTFAFEEPGGSTTLFFDRRDCETGASDIYKIEEAQAT